MIPKVITVGKVKIGGNLPFVFIGGPCVIENRQAVMKIARGIQDITGRLKIPFIFKASYDKANRTSISSFRGPGLHKGLEILREIKNELGVPVTSDVHTIEEVGSAMDILDVIQIPAFLCRQTDLLVAAAQSGKVVNIKKGQFLAPWDMHNVIRKIESASNSKILLTERGVSFGYNTLVTDFRSLAILRQTGYPVVFDASHSVQQPGGLGSVSGGQSEFIPLLARCGVAAGCDGIFLEVHTNPAKSLSDGPNMLPLNKLEEMLTELAAIDAVVKGKQKTAKRKDSHVAVG